MGGDRHGRAHRADNDPRRRPPDGFRVAGTARFRRIVVDAIAALPDRLGSPLRGARLRVVDVPEEPVLTSDGEVVLATLDGGLLTVYRRPVESRADSRLTLEETLLFAIGQAVARAEGLDDDIDGFFE